MAPSTPNPNWPNLFAEGMFGANPFYGVGSFPWTDLTTRLIRNWSFRRGKQFELDLVQPGEFNGQWVNTDGVLDPSNTSSALYPGVLPFRGYRMRAQYPPSVNLLTPDQATGGEGTPLAAGTAGTAYGVTGAYGTVSVAASGTAFQGTQVWQFTGTTASTGSRLISTTVPAVGQNNGVTYTMSMYVRSVTTGANPTVTPIIRWLFEDGSTVQTDTGSPVALTGSPTATWTRVTFTSTMPTSGTKSSALAGVILSASAPGGTWSFQADAMQWEIAGSASAFTVPGTNYPIYFGNIERYPQSWDFTGTYGTVSPIGVDALTMLSQITLKEAYIMDVAAMNPTFFFPLSEASGATQFNEQAGRTPYATIFTAGTGGTLTPGNNITASTLPSGKFLGTGGPIVSVANTNVSGGNGAGTVIDLRSAGITGPLVGGGNIQAFSRVMAVRTTQNGATGPVFAASTSGALTTGAATPAYFIMYLVSGVLTVKVSNSFGFTITCTSTQPSIADGNWHLIGISLDQGGGSLSAHCDGVTTVQGSGVFVNPDTCTGEYIGGEAWPTTGGVSTFFTGDMALYSGWTGSNITSNQFANLWLSFKYAWGTGSALTETSGNRYSRILSWAGYTGASSVDTGQTASMGPATDVSGTDALSALQAVVDTEGGRHFVAKDGTVRFQSRQTIFQTTTPSWTFGEGPPVGGGGEIPMLTVATDFDTTRISNNVSVTVLSTNQTVYATDATSQANYGTRNLFRTTQSTDPEEARSASQYYLARYKDPHMRIQTLTIDAAANPGLFPSVLAFELGQYVKILRRSVTGAPTITMFGFIEQITHSGDDQGKWQVDLQITPGDPVTYGTFTALRTTLNLSATAGASTVTINALPDAATNAIRAELSTANDFYIGTGATQELCSFAVGGVPNLASGYTTAVLTLSAPLVNNHSSSEQVVFDWTPSLAPNFNYDSLAAFDSVYFAY